MSINVFGYCVSCLKTTLLKKYPGLMKMIAGTTMPTVIGKSFFEEQGKDHGGDSVLPRYSRSLQGKLRVNKRPTIPIERTKPGVGWKNIS